MLLPAAIVETLCRDGRAQAPCGLLSVFMEDSCPGGSSGPHQALQEGCVNPGGGKPLRSGLPLQCNFPILTNGLDPDMIANLIVLVTAFLLLSSSSPFPGLSLS